MPQGGELITSQKQSKGYYLILLIILYTYAFKYFLSFGPNFLQQYIKFKTSFTLQVIRYLKIPPFSHLWDRCGRFHKWHFFMFNIITILVTLFIHSNFFICVIDMEMSYSEPSLLCCPSEVRDSLQLLVPSGSKLTAEQRLNQGYVLPKAAHHLWWRKAEYNGSAIPV